VKSVIQALVIFLVDAIKPYIKSFDELKPHEQSLMIMRHFEGTKLIDKMDLTLKELQYIEDEDYYVDIEQELKKDLFEKQRVNDNFLIEHEEERKDLLGFYDNIYVKAEPNKYIHIIYANKFELSRIRGALA